jgi:hypothetical protein
MLVGTWDFYFILIARWQILATFLLKKLKITNCKELLEALSFM